MKPYFPHLKRVIWKAVCSSGRGKGKPKDFPHLWTVLYFFRKSKVCSHLFANSFHPQTHHPNPPPQIPKAFIHSTNIDLALLADKARCRGQEGHRTQWWGHELQNPGDQPLMPQPRKPGGWYQRTHGAHGSAKLFTRTDLCTFNPHEQGTNTAPI